MVSARIGKIIKKVKSVPTSLHYTIEANKLVEELINILKKLGELTDGE